MSATARKVKRAPVKVVQLRPEPSWDARVRVANEAIAALYLTRGKVTDECYQAVLVAGEAVRMLAGGDYGDAGTPARIRRMAEVLEEAPRAREHRWALVMVDAAVGWGKAGRPWGDCARLLARIMGQPAGIVPELARRLAAHYMPTGRGRPPKDKYSTAQIAVWLTGDHEVAKHASRLGKRRK